MFFFRYLRREMRPRSRQALVIALGGDGRHGDQATAAVQSGQRDGGLPSSDSFDVDGVDFTHTSLGPLSDGTRFTIIGLVSQPQGAKPPDVYIPLTRARALGTSQGKLARVA